MGAFRILFPFVVIGVLIYLGLPRIRHHANLDEARDAEIRSLAIEGTRAHAVIVFHRRPPWGDPNQVTFELSSRALGRDLLLDWNAIATRDSLARTRPASEPPLGLEIPVTIDVGPDLRANVEEDVDDFFIDAKLSWADRRQWVTRTGFTIPRARN